MDSFFLQSATQFIANCDIYIYYEVRDDYYKLRQYWEAILLGIPDGKASLAFKKSRRNFIPNQVVDSKANSLLIELFSYRWDNIVN